MDLILKSLFILYDHFLCTACFVLGGIIEETALVGFDDERRKNFPIQNRYGDLIAFDELFNHHFRIHKKTFSDPFHHFFHGAADEGGHGRPTAVGFHHHRKSKVSHLFLYHIFRLSDDEPVACTDSFALQYTLSQVLVHADSAGSHAASGIRQVQTVQNALHRSIFAVFPMESQERKVNPLHLLEDILLAVQNDFHTFVSIEIYILQNFSS